MVRTTKQILVAISTGSSSGSLPERLCVDCSGELRLTGAGMALMNDAGHQAVVGASGSIAAYLEDLQFELGEGPTVDASRNANPGLHPDLTASATSPWVEFGPAAREAGVRAAFAFPLQVGAVRLGCLAMYRPAPGALGREEMTTALAYADAAVVVLLHLQAQATAGRVLAPELGEPLERRAEVHQATGFVSIQTSVGVTEALLLLRAHAFASGRPLLHVARDVLAGRLRLGPDEE